MTFIDAGSHIFFKIVSQVSRTNLISIGSGFFFLLIEEVLVYNKAEKPQIPFL
jgi:hypothetical protein